ncbi:hypothetical protein MP228_009282 [Amoeboaphelidium protococcarum]|nr:hypothetical protein MP228_009282 [Amoeboaphelidium protococcarum]
MPQEATIIVIDNTEWMRNADYTPDRLKAQNDAVSMVFNIKTQSNPENVVGLISMGGNVPELLTPLTNKLGSILNGLHHLKISGKPHLSSALQVASLALKNRFNKNQAMRIVVFIGSPLGSTSQTAGTTDGDEDSEVALIKLAKKLKKNNVAVDIVSFGEEGNDKLLQSFHDAINNNDNSHIVFIPPGPQLLSDQLLNTPIVAGEGGMGGGAGGAGGGYEFGVDPSLDPELALALRISMEEERARQEKGGAPAEGASSTQAPQQANAVPPQTEEEKMLAQAIAMSMGQQAGNVGGDGDVDMEGGDDDDDVARAIQESLMNASSTTGSNNNSSKTPDNNSKNGKQ